MIEDIFPIRHRKPSIEKEFIKIISSKMSRNRNRKESESESVRRPGIGIGIGKKLADSASLQETEQNRAKLEYD